MTSSRRSASRCEEQLFVYRAAMSREVWIFSQEKKNILCHVGRKKILLFWLEMLREILLFWLCQLATARKLLVITGKWQKFRYMTEYFHFDFEFLTVWKVATDETDGYLRWENYVRFNELSYKTIGMGEEWKGMRLEFGLEISKSVIFFH